MVRKKAEEGGSGTAAALRVEYKPCDIEEAMEDCPGGSRQAEREGQGLVGEELLEFGRGNQRVDEG